MSRLGAYASAAILAALLTLGSLFIRGTTFGTAWQSCFVGLGYVVGCIFSARHSAADWQNPIYRRLDFNAIIYAFFFYAVTSAVRYLDLITLISLLLCILSACFAPENRRVAARRNKVMLSAASGVVVSFTLFGNRGGAPLHSVVFGAVMLLLAVLTPSFSSVASATVEWRNSVTAILILAFAGAAQGYYGGGLGVSGENIVLPVVLFIVSAAVFGILSSGHLETLFKGGYPHVIACVAVVCGVGEITGYGVVPYFGINLQTTASFLCIAFLVTRFSFDYPPKQAKVTQLFSNTREGKLRIFLFLTVLIMFLEFFYGLHVNSLGLVSDSFHMLLDAVSICVGLVAASVSHARSSSETHPFGYKRYEVVGGFVNGVLLLFIALFVMMESIERIFDPPEIEGAYLLPVAIVGLLINIVGVVFFHDSHGHSHSHGDHDNCGGHPHASSGQVDHNMRGVYLHILADMLGSVSVIISGVLIHLFGLRVADPICSAISATFILASAFPLLEGTGKVLLLSAPEVEADFCAQLASKISQTTLVSQVESVKVWIHSTPPRDLLFCCVSAKLQQGRPYDLSHETISQLCRDQVASILSISNASIVLHLE